ncbi:hypothetical protein EV714DRAFT_222376, partial [Schizophyllum commune]
HLTDLTAGFHISTLVADITAMANHLFSSVSRKGSNFVLRAFSFFGMAHSYIGPEPTNSLQQRAITDIPKDIRALPKLFDLDFRTVMYAVCPKCGVYYPPTCTAGKDGKKKTFWQPICTEPLLGSTTPCGEPLTLTTEDTTRPVKAACHFPFSDWFGRFIALPKVEEYGDRFCEEIEGQAPFSTPGDEAFIRTLPSPSSTEGALFVADRGKEGRWFFALEVDFFNVEGNIAGGASRSTGVIAMTCLNLPLAMRHDDAYRYVAWILGGPKEPDSKDAQIRHPMRLLTYLSRCDWESWGEASKEYLRTGSKLWLEAPDVKSRKAIERNYGTRYSELWRLPYWDITRQLVVDPMHNIYLGVARRYFMVGLGLQDPKPNTTRETQSAKIAFRHPFALLPPLSKLASVEPVQEPDDGEDVLALEDRPELSSEAAALRTRVAHFLKTSEGSRDLANKVGSIRRRLRVGRPLSVDALKSMVTSASWTSLAYITNDLCLLDPTCQTGILDGLKQKAMKKEIMGQLLNDWAAASVSEPGHSVSASAGRNQMEALESLASRMTHQCAYLVGNVHRLLALPTCEGELGDHIESAPTLAGADEGQEDRVDDSIREPSLGVDLPGEAHDMPGQTDAGSAMDVDDDSSTPRPGSVTPRSRSVEAASVDPVKASRKPLEAALTESATAEALAYVAWELNCHPGKDDKKSLISALVEWRALQPQKGLAWTPIRPHETLSRLHKCLREVIRPTWMAHPRHDVGLPSAGKIKAGHYKTLFDLYVPLCVLSLWTPGSPLAVDDAQSMAGPLETSMLLTCACRAMVSDGPVETQRKKFVSLYTRHLEGLERDCPGISTPNHHLAFHIHDFMTLHGHVRNWWCFPFERLLGRMQRMGINHIPGQYEETLMKSFYQGAFFRQSLMRTNSPYLDDFRRMMDAVFEIGDYENDDLAEEDVVDIGIDGSPEIDESRPPLPSVSERLRAVPVAPRAVQPTTALPHSGVRIGGRIFSASRESNSYITFRARDVTHAEWTAGQIVEMKLEDGHLIFLVRPLAPLHSERKNDPFAAFWEEGFEARSVSYEELPPVSIAVADWDIAHGAYWKLTPEWALIVQVR